ncbi:hypothetical protein O3G_MSEX008682 [Manduca sexta]|uniref:Uncharacterized protein n=1 Tax=Manduca sexta TaxID=7130 RepID=A0A922CQ79_MANSE|nr:hypothetical protein O3G_MSEX008682 [Manduca sexta]
MCIRRKKRYPTTQTKSTKTQTTKKTKRQGCCVRCIRKICGFFCRRIKRRIKKKIINVVTPDFDQYDITGIDIDVLKTKYSPNIDSMYIENFKETVKSTLGRLDVDDIKQKFVDNLDRFSLKKLASVVTLFKNKKKFSKINMSLKDLDLIDGLEFEDLKKKFSIKGSKEKLLEKLIHDYKKGDLSAAGSMSNKSKYNELKKLDKEQLHKMLETYAEKSKNNRLSIAEAIIGNLKTNTSLSSLKRGLFDKVLESFKKGDLSKSATSKICKLDVKKLSKKEISIIIKKFQEQEKKKRRVTFARPSKLEEFKSAVGSYFGKAY